jgi:4-hydroxy-tetrahydrodipicolinate synthase
LGNFKAALDYQDRLMPLHRALFLESNPAGAKYALGVLGKMQPGLRLPLVEVSKLVAEEIEAALAYAQLGA